MGKIAHYLKVFLVNLFYPMRYSAHVNLLIAKIAEMHVRIEKLEAAYYAEIGVRESLAGLCHSQWSGWMEYLFALGADNLDGSFTIPKDLVDRWKRQMNTRYQELSGKEKESDLKEADRIISLLEKKYKHQAWKVIVN